MWRLLVGVALVAAPGWVAPAIAQTSATLPVTCNPNSPGDCVRAQPVVNPDGTAVGGGGGTRTTAAGTSDTVAVPVQGVTGGVPQAVSGFVGSNCLVVTGDQAYTVGAQQQCTMAPSGGVKVGVSYNANIAPATPTAGGLNSALIGGKYYATRPTWNDLNTGALQVDSGGNLYVNNATLPPGAATETTLAGISAKLPTTLGQKTAANSLAVTLASDGSYATAANQTATGAAAQTVQGNVASGAADAGNPTKVGGRYNATALSLTDGQRGDVQLTGRGLVRVAVGVRSIGRSDGVSASNIGTVTDRDSNDVTSVPLWVVPSYFNGTTLDTVRGDTTGAYTVSKGTGNLATGQVSVGTTSTLLVAARAGRGRVIASVGSANTCAFGNTGVTNTTGFPLQPTAGASLTLDTSAAIYAVCSATTTVSYVEQF